MVVKVTFSGKIKASRRKFTIADIFHVRWRGKF